jgi:hypothetical protein
LDFLKVIYNVISLSQKKDKSKEKSNKTHVRFH